jgi:site-specific DNA recombinase
MEERKRVGIWIRVSTDMQVKDDSPEHHERRAKLYAETKNWEVVQVYRLDAVSGKTVMEQPEAKKMLADIRRGHISGLIFSKLARLARNTKELLEFADIFRDQNADLISLAEAIDTSSPAGRLFFTIIAAMAQWEREEISSRVAASVPIRAQMGKSLGGAAPYGYRWENKTLLVDEKEAPIRALMYEIFREQRRIKTTADILNKKGYRTRKGELFSDNTVNRLLRDPMAKGERRANYTKSPGKGKQWQFKPASEWVVTTCPAIITSELWEECNGILDEQEKKRKKPGRRAIYLLTGYVNCSCGKGMYITHASKNYACKGCKNRIPADDLDSIYQEYLKGYLTSTDAAQYRSTMGIELVEKERLYELTKEERDRLAKRRTQLVNLRLDGELDKEGFQEEYKPLEGRLSQLEEQLPLMEAEIDYQRIQHQSADVVIADAKTLYEQWPEMPFESKRVIVETITRHITIGKDDIHIALAVDPTFSRNEGHIRQNHIPALPFSRMTKIVAKPMGMKYVENPVTIGQKIRNRRLELRLLQKDVAAMFNVVEDTITLWENERSKPLVYHYPKLIEFLGYMPFEIDTSTLAGQMKRYRYLNGLSQEDLAKRLSINESTVFHYEKETHMPSPQLIKRLHRFIQTPN